MYTLGGVSEKKEPFNVEKCKCHCRGNLFPLPRTKSSARASARKPRQMSLPAVFHTRTDTLAVSSLGSRISHKMRGLVRPAHCYLSVAMYSSFLLLFQKLLHI